MVMLGFMMSALYIIFRRVTDSIANNQFIPWKGSFCFFLSFFILTSTIVVIAINIFQVGVLIADVELELWVKSFIFLSVELMWMLVCIMSLSLLWKNIYDKQLIPGEGTVKERLVKNFNLFKVSFRRKK